MTCPVEDENKKLKKEKEEFLKVITTLQDVVREMMADIKK